MRSHFLFTLFLALSSLSFGQIIENCKSETTPIRFSYCIYKDSESKNADVLYYMHGKGLSERAWRDPMHYSTLIQEEWKAMGYQLPTVVSISFGQVWLMMEKNQSNWSGLFEAVNNLIIPAIETKLGFAGRRLLIGESMGGFNASQLLLKSKLAFDRVALLCPAIVSISPYSNKEEIESYIARNHADPELVSMMQTVSRMFLSGPEDWEKTSPLVLAEKNLSPSSPEVYVSCGSIDEFGFFEGAKKFYETAVKNGTKAEWRPLYGRHCSVDAKSIATFLSGAPRH